MRDEKCNSTRFLFKDRKYTEYLSRRQAVDQAIRESFDYEDPKTILDFHLMTEAAKDNALIALANKVYKLITDKISDIDYGTIEKSEGDIERFSNYGILSESIETIMEVAEKSGTGIAEAQVLSDTLNYLITYKNTFIRGFKLNIDIIKVLYKNTVLSLIADVSYFTSICIEFIKTPENTVEMEFQHLQEFNSKFGFIHKALQEFNMACKSGELEKAFDGLITAKSKRFISGLGVLGIIGASIVAIPAILMASGLILFKVIVPLLREMTYFFFATRLSISDYFKLQKELLEANADLLERNKSDKDVVSAQRKWATRFEKISNIFAIDYTPTVKKAEKEIKEDTKKATTNDIDYNPDDTADNGTPVLF